MSNSQNSKRSVITSALSDVTLQLSVWDDQYGDSDAILLFEALEASRARKLKSVLIYHGDKNYGAATVNKKDYDHLTTMQKNLFVAVSDLAFVNRLKADAPNDGGFSEKTLSEIGTHRSIYDEAIARYKRTYEVYEDEDDDEQADNN